MQSQTFSHRLDSTLRAYAPYIENTLKIATPLVCGYAAGCYFQVNPLLTAAAFLVTRVAISTIKKYTYLQPNVSPLNAALEKRRWSFRFKILINEIILFATNILAGCILGKTHILPNAYIATLLVFATNFLTNNLSGNGRNLFEGEY